MLHIAYSNRLERLAEQLMTLLQADPGEVFAPEIIVVPGQGMARWLALRLAQGLGVCANVRFLLPAAFVWELFARVTPGLPGRSGFDPEVMGWRILDRLPELARLRSYPELAAYLDGADDAKLYALARRIAEAFDRYLVYRPEWIRAWEAGAETHWQAALWRSLVASSDGLHWVRVQDEFLGRLRAGDFDTQLLPRRVSLFAVPAFSPGYMEVLSELARYVDVQIYALNPCAEYWGDIVSRREESRRATRGGADAAYLEVGNGLLAALGQTGRDCFDLLQGLEATWEEDFEDPGQDALLQRIQADILHLRQPGDATDLVGAGGDRSVQLHVCHSAMREVEVLHDQLLALLEADSELHPSDIAVMAPDLGPYVPYIEAVFDAAAEPRRIPYGIADHPLPPDHPVAEAFFALLDLPASRMDATFVLGLLEVAEIQSCFAVSDEDLGRLRLWTEETAIRWGQDGASRSELGLPPLPEHTWRWGLDRMMLGYALGETEDALFEGIAPYAEIEGQDAQLMGRFEGFVETLFEWRGRLAHDRGPGEWVSALRELVARFLGAAGEPVQVLYQALNTLQECTGLAGVRSRVSRTVVREALQTRIAGTVVGAPPLNGGVSFGSMATLRGIPFRVIALLGLNDGEFPRIERPLGFDLMAVDFRKGDRSSRADDRYLLLEALISARSCLYLSYVGQDLRDNTAIPPSVVLSEFLDHLSAGRGREVVETALVTHHPLQPFSPRYFTGSGPLFSYSHAMCAASLSIADQAEGMPPFLSAELPDPGEAWRELEVDRFVGFFMNPARFLLRERLDVVLEAEEIVLETREPFTLGYRERERLVQGLVRAHLEGRSGAQVERLIRARGWLPQGQVGTVLVGEEERRIVPLAQALGKLIPESPRLLDVDLDLGPVHFRGRIGDLGPAGRVVYTEGAWRAHGLLRTWLHHLILCAAAPPEVPHHTHLLSLERSLEFGPVADARAHLCTLAGLFRDGLRRPLPLFPRSAYAYARARQRQVPDPWAPAIKAWEGSDYGVGESENPYYRLMFREGLPLGAGDPRSRHFEAVSLAVFEPMLSMGEGWP